MSALPPASPADAASAAKYNITAAELEELRTRSMAAKANAYCPYSHFRVGAALLTTSPEHTYISGANVENASYPVGTCAERCALAAAVGTLGLRLGQLRAIAVATDVVDRPPTSPCGMCRQFLREFMGNEVGIFMFGGDGVGVVRSLGELLPDSFGPDALPPRSELPVYEGK